MVVNIEQLAFTFIDSMRVEILLYDTFNAEIKFVMVFPPDMNSVGNIIILICHRSEIPLLPMSSDCAFIEKKELSLDDAPTQRSAAANRSGGRIKQRPVSDSSDEEEDDYDTDPHAVSTADILIMQSSFRCRTQNLCD